MKRASANIRSAIASGAKAAACALLLSGCQTLVQEDWHPQPSHPPLPDYVVEVANADLPAICGEYPGMRLYGCARRDFVAKVCLIYTGPRPAEWLLAHERKHCAGWDHGPGYVRATAAAAVAAR